MASDFDLNAAWCPDYMGLDDEEHDFPAHNEQGNFDLNLEPHEDESNFIQPTEVLEHQANDNTMVAVNHHKRSRLNSEDKLQIFCWLLNKAKAGKLKRGSIKDAASVFNLSVRCIISIWNTARKQSSSMQSSTYDFANFNGFIGLLQIVDDHLKIIRFSVLGSYLASEFLITV
ncbi:hypothetical protein BVRB_9g205370 [Beta vulgaris subsp. vulgaris]|nr:hypothetical protein BVRB_9g205370 [Beta vulgaris subsp. vulgaris]